MTSNFCKLAATTLLLGLSSQAAALTLVDIAPGNGAHLEQAFAEAWQRGGATTIRLAPGSTYHVSTLLPLLGPQQTGKQGLDIHLQGRGARLIFDSPGDGIQLNAGERLKLSQLDISITLPSHAGSSFFDFAGEVVLEDVGITDSHMQGNKILALANVSGSLHAVNLTMARNRVETALMPGHALLKIASDAYPVVLENVTIADNSGRHADRSTPIGLQFHADSGSQRPSVVNSIIDHCDADSINSQGGNVFLDANCGVKPNDRLVADAAFLTLGRHGGLSSTYALAPVSPAIGAGLTARCAATDARGQVRNKRCDAGAYQFGVGSAEAELASGGVNGAWYDVAGSGVLMVNRNNERDVLLVWLGYDKQQHERWVYATLPFALSGSSAAAYVNDVAPNTPSGWPTARRVGTLSIDFVSCEKATLRFSSTTGDLSSFEINLSRLTYTAQVGCVEALK